MTKNKIVKLIACGAVASVIGSASDKIVDRPEGHNPTPTRLAVVIAAVVALNYALAYTERFVDRKVR